MSNDKGGRPEKVLDWSLFEQLCAVQCTQSEICSMMKVHTETLYKHVLKHYGEPYPDVYKRFSETGLSSLRRTQYVLAKKNAAMAIWLGKNWLNQKDQSKETEQMLNTFTNMLSQIDSTKDLVKKPEEKDEG